MIRVLLADDHEMVRDALSKALDGTPGIRVVGQAAGGAEAIRRVAETEPDVVVLDYSMRDMDGPETIRRIVDLSPAARILILTLHESIHYAVKALESGASGYVTKSAGLKELVAGIQALATGETYVSPALSSKVIHHLRRPRKDRHGLDALSEREFDLLRTLGAGMSLGVCAQRLHVGTSTASTYRSRLMEKLNLHSTAEIIRFAIENGIVG